MIAWGIDPGLRRFYIAVVQDGKLLGVYGDEFKTGKDATATVLRHLQSRVEDCAMAAWSEHGAPDAIIVEQPINRGFDNPTLKYAVGVTLAALSKHGYVDMLAASTWRKIIFGKGNMRTADAKKAALLTAATVGYTGDSEDAAEAVCIALAVEKEITKSVD